LRERKTPDCRNTPSTTNPEDEVIVDAPGNDGNASMLEQVKRPNPWMMMMIMNAYSLNSDEPYRLRVYWWKDERALKKFEMK